MIKKKLKFTQENVYGDRAAVASAESVQRMVEEVNERLVKLEKDVEYLKKSQDAANSQLNEIKVYLQKFIDSVDDKYARKSDLETLREDFTSALKDQKAEQKEINKWTNEKILVIGEKLAVASVLILLLGKQFGWF